MNGIPFLKGVTFGKRPGEMGEGRKRHLLFYVELSMLSNFLAMLTSYILKLDFIFAQELLFRKAQ